MCVCVSIYILGRRYMYVCIYICTLLNVYCKCTVAFHSLCCFFTIIEQGCQSKVKVGKEWGRRRLSQYFMYHVLLCQHIISLLQQCKRKKNTGCNARCWLGTFLDAPLLNTSDFLTGEAVKGISFFSLPLSNSVLLICYLLIACAPLCLSSQLSAKC